MADEITPMSGEDVERLKGLAEKAQDETQPAKERMDAYSKLCEKLSDPDAILSVISWGEAAHQELAGLDATLARRPALDDEPTRYAKVAKAIATAGRAETAENTSRTWHGVAEKNGAELKAERARAEAAESRAAQAEAAMREMAEALQRALLNLHVGSPETHDAGCQCFYHEALATLSTPTATAGERHEFVPSPTISDFCAVRRPDGHPCSLFRNHPIHRGE